MRNRSHTMKHNPQFYERRRRRFFRAMRDGVAILSAARHVRRSGDVAYPFRQDSDFFYLTGFPEPEAIAVLTRNRGATRYVLFVRPRDPEAETWTGRRIGTEGAVADYGADESYPLSEFGERIKDILAKQPVLYMRLGVDRQTEWKVLEAIEDLKAEARKGLFGPWEIVDPRTILWDMRVVKDRSEVAALRKACRIAVEAFRNTLAEVRPRMGEWEVAARIEYEFKRLGADDLAFETICAYGANSTVLHYCENRSRLGSDALLLLDAGCEYDFACSDVTRTVPVSGRFSEPALTVYRWVMKAQQAAIETTRPGASYEEVHNAALEVLCQGLRSMGVLKGKTRRIIEDGTYKPYFMHRIGHFIGSDVHDVGHYYVADRSVELRPGMALTIEPGLYFPDQEFVPEWLRGIGVRIEDDVLVTRDGVDVLTADLPKEPAQVEEVMGSG